MDAGVLTVGSTSIAQDFGSYRRVMEGHVARIYHKFGSLEEEDVIPAYLHPNPLMRWLTWQKLRVVCNYLERRARALAGRAAFWISAAAWACSFHTICVWQMMCWLVTWIYDGQGSPSSNSG